MPKQKIVLKIFGLVQGVGFRYYTAEKAEELGLNGWVRNEPDGSVTIVAQGEKANLEKLVEWAKKGPFLARVKDVKIEWQELTNSIDAFPHKGFRIR